MLTDHDTGPEALAAWAQRNGVTSEALSLALKKMADQSIECLVKELNAGDRGDAQSLVDSYDRQDLNNYFIEQICFIPSIHQYIGAVVGPSSDGLTPLYRQARTCTWEKSAVVPWQNPDWVAAQWGEYFLARETQDAEESLYRLDTAR